VPGRAVIPHPFDEVVPMEPVSHPRPFSRPDYRFQLKFDGVRIVAFVGGGGVRLQNRRLRDRTGRYPELAGLVDDVAAEEAVLDGEMVVLKDGKPSFPAILERDLAGSDRRARLLAGESPALYAVFDLLSLDGRDLRDRPWSERQALLARALGSAVEGSPRVHLVESFDSGEALFDAVSEAGMEGLVAKRVDSPYVPGKRSKAWLKVKLRRYVDCVIGGFSRRGEEAASLLVGLYRDGDLLYVGRVGSGIASHEALALGRALSREEVGEPPFANPPRRAGYAWVRPRHVALVEFAEWTEGLRLRAPSFKGLRDVPAESCTLD